MNKAKIITDSIKIFTAKFTVKTNTKIFKDAILTIVMSRPDYLKLEETVPIKKVSFSRFK
ncbi:hypothetical protein ES692_16255 [Psychroserpens burtonensis]|uniref:Uncharacterized protein n=1 Tax=Psychroserpens burtonensis TaxID=49278 RepID=A0A5C7BC85_9FLAO|nr:hypothetical protein [Psychroserpens burtonensis]TXE15534.1 hypothetical protein ES692_16255 [Psychroserpens burtonensis]